jgi:hypothetical protein
MCQPWCDHLHPSCCCIPFIQQQTEKAAFAVKITGIDTGDAQFYVPRCVSGSGGNINLDAINKKVLVLLCRRACICSTLQHGMCGPDIPACPSQPHMRQTHCI